MNLLAHIQATLCYVFDNFWIQNLKKSLFVKLSDDMNNFYKLPSIIEAWKSLIPI